jgi:phosphate-selective porin OprO and OprP
MAALLLPQQVLQLSRNCNKADMTMTHACSKVRETCRTMRRTTKPEMKRETITTRRITRGWRRCAVGAITCATLCSPALAQTPNALIDALIKKGVLTEQEAREIASELEKGKAPAPLVRPSSANIKDLDLRGRVQAQFGHTHAENDAGSDDYSTLELRRVRLGIRASLMQNVRAHVEANVVPNTFSMRSAYLEWREHKPAYIRVGLEKPLFSYDETTSSAAILTVERSHINNLMWAADAQMTGVSIEGAASVIQYGAGIYTGQANANAEQFDHYLFNGSVGLSLDRWLPDDHKLKFRLDGIINDDPVAIFRYEYGLAASTHYSWRRFELRTEYLQGHPFGGGSIRGGYIMPSYYFTEKLQGVLRYEIATADHAFIPAPGRYARRTSVTPADLAGARIGTDYQAFYLGANYYIKGDHLKLMAGLEYSELDNTDRGRLQAYTVYGAIRMLY